MPITNSSMDLTGKTQASTYQNLVQTSASVLLDGLGNQLNLINITASYALNGTSGSVISGSNIDTSSLAPKLNPVFSGSITSSGYMYASKSLWVGGIDSSSIFCVSQSTQFGLTATGSATGSIVYSTNANYYPAVGYTQQIRVYPYKFISSSVVGAENRLYSKYFMTASVTDNNGATLPFYSINWSWPAVSGADGYKVAKKDDYNPTDFEEGVDVTNTSFSDFSAPTTFFNANTSDAFLSPKSPLTSSFSINAGGVLKITSITPNRVPYINNNGMLMSSDATDIDIFALSGMRFGAGGVQQQLDRKIEVDTGSYLPISVDSASWSPGSGGGTTLVTASTYQITSSWSNKTISASYSTTASFALNAGNTLTTASTYPITSSNAISASWANRAGAAISASWASSSFSSVSASWASNSFASVSSSYASRSLSASFASVTSASYANTSSWALNVINLPTSNAIITSSVHMLSASYDNTIPSATVMTYTIPSSGMYRVSVTAIGNGDETSLYTMLWYHLEYVDELGSVSHQDPLLRLQVGNSNDSTPCERAQLTYCFSAVNATSFVVSWDTVPYISGSPTSVTGALQVWTKVTLEKLI